MMLHVIPPLMWSTGLRAEVPVPHWTLYLLEPFPATEANSHLIVQVYQGDGEDRVGMQEHIFGLVP